MNVLIIMSDEHRKDALGCAGHPRVKTPALDRLAREGTRFTNAYCNSPLCVPSRASFATGRYLHDIAFWDNAKPYTGTPESWGAHLGRQGVDSTTIGKLDFLEGTLGGFSDQRLPEHRTPPGDIEGLYRAPVRQRHDGRQRMERAGPSQEEGFFNTELETAETVRFLTEEAPHRKNPWVLWLNYLPPHFPLRPPQPFYDLYPLDSVDLPFDNPARDRHPMLEELRFHFNVSGLGEDVLRRTRAAYYGLCTYLDVQIGSVLEALEASGLEEDTLVIYTSDHGESLGDHELWWKCSMFEEAAGIPLIVRVPGGSRGVTNDTPVSLVDVTATLADAVGVPAPETWRGTSLLRVLDSETASPRLAFSEYHGHGSSHGMFMIRQGRYKYIYYPHNPPQLFDLDEDPRELADLADRAEFSGVIAALHAELLTITDPDAVDALALQDQRERLAAYNREDKNAST